MTGQLTHRHPGRVDTCGDQGTAPARVSALLCSGGKDQQHEGVSLDDEAAKGASLSGLVFPVCKPRTLNGAIVRQEADRSASARWASGGSPHLCLRVVSFCLSLSFPVQIFR